MPTRPVLALLATALCAGASVSAAAPAPRPAGRALPAVASPAPYAPRERAERPEDRYALAGGCYTARSLATGRYVARSGGSFAATGTTGEPLHFQALDLGKYLLFGTAGDFLAGEPDPSGRGARPAGETAAGYVRGTGDETPRPVRDPALAAVTTTLDAAELDLAGDAVVAAATPGHRAEWVLHGTDRAGEYTLHIAVDDHDEASPGPLDPQIAATLVVHSDGVLRLAGGRTTGADARFGFEQATGCAAWPEVEVNVSGPYPAGELPYQATRGYLDAHLHMMAFEFLGGMARCGRPWHPYGVTYALVDCPDHEPGGRGAVLEQVLSGQAPGDAHDTAGWPTFGYWPKHDSLTHEQVYYRWLERAWRGGLRMFTNLLVDNGVLCEIYPYKRNSCNEMDGVRLQAQRLRELERYVDAQSGGPGRGWFRIVTDPFQARRVVNSGRLAVVMGIEVSVPLDCGEILGIPRCDASQIEQQLDEVYALGVRQMELTNKFDNGLTGVTGDTGALGVIVNQGNRYETGHYWRMETCAEEPGHGEHDHRHDKQQYNLADESGGALGRDAIFGGVLQVFGPTGLAPLYPAGPHCNTAGLTPLGRVAIDGLKARGMIFDPDHMSAKAREEALDHVGTYSGVVSSHSWADDPTYRRILEIGGVVTPHAGGSAGFVGEWRTLRAWGGDGFGLGFGSDVNGFSRQGGPRNPGEAGDVDYPFTGLGGVTIDRQRSGQQTYDVNTDGVDHYGLYPDWVEDGRILAGADGAAFAEEMARGAEAYLLMWERAVGVRAASCLGKDDAKRVRHGMSPEEVLVAVGQPQERDGTGWTYCGGVEVVFGADGSVAKVNR